MAKAFRNFTFTLNNWQDKVAAVENLNNLECRYIVFGKEVGDSGTPHLQGTVIWKNAKTESAARKALSGCHVEVCKDLQASIEYCKKDGNVTERGTAPMSKKDKAVVCGQAEQDRWMNIRHAAEEGRLEDIPDQIRFMHYKCINYHREQGRLKRKLEDTEEQHEWYWGPSGTGKSRKARTENPEAYLKNCNKWWDGYSDQDIVLIEDFDKKHDVLGHHMKIWADRYPFNAEIKGGSTGNIRPKKIVVTSNYHPEHIWSAAQDLEPILRRFKVTAFGEYPEKIAKRAATTLSTFAAQYGNWD